MPRNAVVSIEFEARMQGIEKALKASTDTTTAEVRKQIATLRKFQRTMSKDIPKSAKDAERAVKKNIGGMRKIFEGIQGPAGSAASRITALGEAVMELGPLGAAGVAAAGIGLITAALYKAASASGQLTEEQDTLKASMESLTAYVGGAFAEEFRGILKAVDSLVRGLENAALAFFFIKRVGSRAVDALKGDISGLSDIIGFALGDTFEWKQEMDQLALSMGEAGKAAKKLKDPWLETLAVIDEARSDTLTDDQKAYAAFDARIEKLAELASAESMTIESIAFAEKALLERLERDLEANRFARHKAVMNRVEERNRRAKQAAADEALIEAERKRAAEAEEARVKRQMELDRAAAFAKVDLALAAASQLAGIISTQAEASKALAIFEIGVSTAAGIAKAIEQYGLPWGLIPAGLTAAMGVAQVAAVNAEPKPSFHVGGLLGTTTPLATDETFRALKTEQPVGIMTPQGMNAANGGRGGGGQTINIVQQLDHKAFNAQTAQNLQTNSPLARAIKTQRRGPVGHRSRR